MTRSQHESEPGGRRGVINRLLAAAVALSLLSAACGSSAANQEAAAIGTENRSMFAFESLTDWVSYATAVAVVEVVSEEILPLEEPEEFERLIARRVTVEFEDVLWGEEPPDPTMRTFAEGWFENTREGTRRPFVPMDGPRFEVGGRYVAAFIVWRGEWSRMTSSSVIPLVGDVLAPVPGAPDVAAAMAGLTLDDLRERLATAEPDPLAAKYFHLDAIERKEAVDMERYGSIEHEPGPDELP